jgi:hypothetical protein
MYKKSFVLGILVIFIALVLAACGGEESKNPYAQVTLRQATRGKVVKVLNTNSVIPRSLRSTTTSESYAKVICLNSWAAGAWKKKWPAWKESSFL